MKNDTTFKSESFQVVTESWTVWKINNFSKIGHIIKLFKLVKLQNFWTLQNYKDFRMLKWTKVLTTRDNIFIFSKT